VKITFLVSFTRRGQADFNRNIPFTPCPFLRQRGCGVIKRGKLYPPSVKQKTSFCLPPSARHAGEGNIKIPVVKQGFLLLICITKNKL